MDLTQTSPDSMTAGYSSPYAAVSWQGDLASLRGLSRERGLPSCASPTTLAAVHVSPSPGPAPTTVEVRSESAGCASDPGRRASVVNEPMPCPSPRLDRAARTAASTRSLGRRRDALVASGRVLVGQWAGPRRAGPRRASPASAPGQGGWRCLRGPRLPTGHPHGRSTPGGQGRRAETLAVKSHSSGNSSTRPKSGCTESP
ncbi:hypothetical protein GGR56DRAFT_248661 [Xylariaceae sp. FL0804]|nr:hypothetical protein GGR56DRAFT_248661 [Xylariaceae sp. FL0804]